MPTLSDRATRGMFALTVAQICIVLSGYVIAVALARSLGPALYGVYGIVYSVLLSVELIGRLGLPLQGLTLPHDSGRFPQAVTRPGPPRSASRRSGRQAQGRRPALNHHRLIRALLFLACTAELTGGAPANAMAPGTPQESGACPRVCEAAEETAALRRAARPNSVFTGNPMSDGECGCRPVSLLGTETAWHIAARLHGAAPIRETRRRRGS